MKPVETKIISGAMYELANTIQSNDGVAKAACEEAAERLDEQTIGITVLNNKVKLFTRAINQIDDYFEYSMESKKDQEKVHQILSELASSLSHYPGSIGGVQ